MNKPFAFPRSVQHRTHVSLNQKITMQFLRLVQMNPNRPLRDIYKQITVIDEKELVSLVYPVPTKVLEDEIPLVKIGLIQEIVTLITAYGPSINVSEFSVLHAHEMILTSC